MSSDNQRSGSRQVITLLTDFSIADGFVGTMKGVILGINPDAVVVDIAHDLPSWDIKAAAFVLHAAYRYFPSGTIHTCVIDPGVGSDRAALIVTTQDHLFVAPDNGVLTLVFEHEPFVGVYRITNLERCLPVISNTFHGRDIFAPIAAHLSNGVPVSEIGIPYTKGERFSIPKPRIENGYISGEIVYQDHFGNLVSNIHQRDLNRARIGRKAKLVIKDTIISGMRTSYSGVPEGELLMLVSSAGYLEVACHRRSAAEILDAAEETPVEITTRERV